MALTILTSWSLQSPDGTVWVPSITTDGVVTFTPGGSIITVSPPVFQGIPETVIWTPTIENNGILTITDGIAAGEFRAALVDSNGVTWTFTVTPAGVVFVGLYTANPVVFRWGTDRFWGEGWRWGYGVTDPWVPKGHPLIVDRFTIDTYSDRAPAFTIPGSHIYAISNTGVVTRHFDAGGSIPDETFFLQSPNGQWWAIIADGQDGTQTTFPVSGEAQPIGLVLPSPDGRVWHYLILNDGSLFLQTPVQWFSSGDAMLYQIDNNGLLATRYNVDGTVPDEVFSVQAPDGMWWEIRVDGHTGQIGSSQVSGPSGTVGKQIPSPDGRLWTFGVTNAGDMTIGFQVQTYVTEPSA